MLKNWLCCNFVSCLCVHQWRPRFYFCRGSFSGSQCFSHMRIICSQRTANNRFFFFSYFQENKNPGRMCSFSWDYGFGNVPALRLIWQEMVCLVQIFFSAPDSSPAVGSSASWDFSTHFHTAGQSSLPIPVFWFRAPNTFLQLWFRGVAHVFHTASLRRVGQKDLTR